MVRELFEISANIQASDSTSEQINIPEIFHIAVKRQSKSSTNSASKAITYPVICESSSHSTSAITELALIDQAIPLFSGSMIRLLTNSLFRTSSIPSTSLLTHRKSSTPKIELRPRHPFKQQPYLLIMLYGIQLSGVWGAARIALQASPVRKRSTGSAHLSIANNIHLSARPFIESPARQYIKLCVLATTYPRGYTSSQLSANPQDQFYSNH
ncbi:hypothetical protein BDZ45DRAFT_746497 [Acephala macrosclerotiorum]|nr:hypothetical protein BDZ45DRAFT_746497 [Acephala macrosclerotiorum]